MSTDNQNRHTERDGRGRFQPGNQLARGNAGPRGNLHSFKHGLKSDRFGLELARLPAPCSGINKRVRTLRRILEHLTLDIRGELGPVQLMLVQTACRHEQTALQIQRWMNLKAADMSHSERLSYMTAFSRESDLRDKAVKELGLQRDTKSIIDAWYAESESEGDDGSDE